MQHHMLEQHWCSNYTLALLRTTQASQVTTNHCYIKLFDDCV
jgi:hypothetical protein